MPPFFVIELFYILSLQIIFVKVVIHLSKITVYAHSDLFLFFTLKDLQKTCCLYLCLIMFHTLIFENEQSIDLLML